MVWSPNHGNTAFTVPVFDEFMKRTIPDAQLWVVPRTSHPINLEEPEAFNRTLLDFFAGVDRRT